MSPIRACSNSFWNVGGHQALSIAMAWTGFIRVCTLLQQTISVVQKVLSCCVLVAGAAAALASESESLADRVSASVAELG
jgi:hypothetical protein